MSVKKEPSGRRSIRVEVEVPGTPEQVWQAIATGPGISAWFVPTKVDGRPGGSIACSFGPGMESAAQITTWDPPRKLAAEDRNWMPGAPSMATEWTVEARGGGTCIVRVVHSLFASTDDWNDQLENVESGWPAFFRVLRRYLEQFAGQRSALVQAMAMASGSMDEAWATLVRALGLKDPRVGQPVRVQVPGAALLTGTIDRVDHVAHGHGIMVRLDGPVGGTGLFGTYACGGLLVNLQFYLYGNQAEAVASRDQAAWQAWLAATFPAVQSA